MADRVRWRHVQSATLRWNAHSTQAGGGRGRNLGERCGDEVGCSRSSPTTDAEHTLCVVAPLVRRKWSNS